MVGVPQRVQAVVYAMGRNDNCRTCAQQALTLFRVAWLVTLCVPVGKEASAVSQCYTSVEER